MIHSVLTVAGSDPSGGAGIQADLKTLSTLKVYGMAVVAALTAQNSSGVGGIFPIPADVVGRQLDAVLEDIRPDAVKTGMLGNAEIVQCVSERFRRYRLERIVVDPVLASTGGVPLLTSDALPAMRSELFALALLVTPNMAEAAMLTGSPVENLEQMEEAARRIKDFGSGYVLVKGGHLSGDAVDVLFDGRTMTHFRSARLPSQNSHGTGCVLSSALAAMLARGLSVYDAVPQARKFVENAIRRGLAIGKGRGPCDPVGIEES